MRISLRTSGGRGEYEIAGRHHEIGPHEIVGRPIELELTPGLIVPVKQQLLLRDGKHRIRIIDNGIHAYRFLAALLLLPKPIRELSKTGGGSALLASSAYSILDIGVEVSQIAEEKVVLRPQTLVAGNSLEERHVVRFDTRLAQVMRLWRLQDQFDSNLRVFIAAHEQSLRIGASLKSVEKARDQLYNALGTDRDILARLLAQTVGSGYDPPTTEDEGVDETPEDDGRTIEEASRQTLRRWRQVASRGAEGRRFANEVKEAYDHRCLFSGERLPKTEATLSAGVDAAHILPWSSYAINEVRNGICLCKSCHWAFDAGVIDLVCESAEYYVQVNPDLAGVAESAGFDVGVFERIEGALPRDRLPNEESEWPSPEYIRRLNALIAGQDPNPQVD